MTAAEFKAWFEGFSEAIGGTPNEDQFDKIKAKVREIDDRTKPSHLWNGQPQPRYNPNNHVEVARMPPVTDRM